MVYVEVIQFVKLYSVLQQQQPQGYNIFRGQDNVL